MSENSTVPNLTPTLFIAQMNDVMAGVFENVTIEGEVASFKVNQGKWVFFDLKDEESSVACFMTLWDLRMPVEDGMKVVVRGTPKVTKWGKFSFTVSSIKPVGEGNIKKSFEMLKKKLEAEGLFNPEKKREIPKGLDRIGVISSTGAAGYADFIKIVNARWGGMKIQVAHTQVQGMDAPDQIIRALKYFNERSEVEAIVILRGGGSADDLSAFNDEQLARAIASSKIPVMTGIGHEVDESLADLAADVRASTPSNAAELLTYDGQAVARMAEYNLEIAGDALINRIERMKREQGERITQVMNIIYMRISNYRKELSDKIKILGALNPEKVLRRGYAIISGEMTIGNVVKITTADKEISAEIKEINERAEK